MKTCLLCEEEKTELSNEKITCDECEKWLIDYKKECVNKEFNRIFNN